MDELLPFIGFLGKSVEDLSKAVKDKLVREKVINVFCRIISDLQHSN